MTTSTVYSTNIYTVTSCAADVTNCPKGEVTTELVSLYTTICPVESVPPGPKGGVKVPETAPPPTPTDSSVVASSATLPAATSPPGTSPVASAPEVPSYTTSTVYSTNIYTVTSCAPGVTDCPASKDQVTTEIIAISTTVCPVTEKKPKESAPATETGPYSTTAVTISTVFGTSTAIVTSTISFIDTPAPTTPPGTAGTIGTSASSPVTTGLYQNNSNPCTTLTLGKYFTTVIEYQSMTAQTSATEMTQPSMDVPSYQMGSAQVVPR